MRARPIPCPSVTIAAIRFTSFPSYHEREEREERRESKKEIE